MPALLTKTLWTAYALGAWPGSPLIDGGVVTLADRADGIKFLLRDQDTTFTTAFNAVFTAVGVRIIKTPVQAPRANAIAERWIASARRECLDPDADHR